MGSAWCECQTEPKCFWCRDLQCKQILGHRAEKEVSVWVLALQTQEVLHVMFTDTMLHFSVFHLIALPVYIVTEH